MRPVAIIIAVFLFAAGCRGDFPSLNDGPAGPPPELTAARSAAPATAAALERARNDLDAAPDAPTFAVANGRPAQLLAALPADEAVPSGVIRRVAKAAKDSGRIVQVMAIGQTGRTAAEAAAAQIRARGAAVRVGTFTPTRPTPVRIELYLLP